MMEDEIIFHLVFRVQVSALVTLVTLPGSSPRHSVTAALQPRAALLCLPSFHTGVTVCTFSHPFVRLFLSPGGRVCVRAGVCVT